MCSSAILYVLVYKLESVDHSVYVLNTKPLAKGTKATQSTCYVVYLCELSKVFCVSASVDSLSKSSYF